MTNVFSGKKFPHAFLFSGPKGTGKTSSARIIAKVVNCQNRKNQEPCNKCSFCRSINENKFLDLIEIDAASNRGIDDIRELREKIKLAPTEGKYKVYVIDEVHMLTTEAFNALLKTLEEPPPHAIFILCTTEIHKLPETIISRCSRFDFQRATTKEIKRSLKRVIKGEKIKIDDEALNLIAKNADGSFRDGVKLLEQLSLSKRKITQKQVQEFFDKGSNVKPKDFVEILLKKESKKAIEQIEKLTKSGIDQKWFISQLLEELRQRLLSAFEQEKSTVELIQLINLIHEASVQLKNAIIPQLPLEVAVIEWLEDKVDKQDFLKSGNGENRAKENIIVKKNAEVNNKINKKHQVIAWKDILLNWPIVLKKVKPFNHSVEALLKAAQPLKLEGESLIIEVFYVFHKERLESGKCLDLVQNAVRDIFKFPLKIKYILGEKKKLIAIKRNKEDDLLKTAEEIFGSR